MATPLIWKNVAVAMQSAIAASKTITAITKASPGVVSSTAHGYANGDYVLLEVQGMSLVNKRIFRVANQAANTFELEGENTTSYDAFSSGTAKLLTLGTSIATMTTVNPSGGEATPIDVTTIHDNQRVEIFGLPGAISYSFDNIWDPSDAGLIALKSASVSQAERAFKFTFGTGGRIFLFYGQVSAGLNPAGSAQGIVTTSVSISATGPSTSYSS
jgi:hypothetical protein